MRIIEALSEQIENDGVVAIWFIIGLTIIGSISMVFVGSIIQQLIA